MTFNLDKSGWKHVAFADVVRNVNETVRDFDAAGIDRIIAMEHMDPSELKISRWGLIKDGTTFTRRVKPGQTLFGKRRAYQRKVACAEFDAICSGDIYTFEADETQLLGDFLPFLVQSNEFFDHALGTSVGSLSPRTNWRDLANFEFDLPPLDEQRRIADLLWATERHRWSLSTLGARRSDADDAWLDHLYRDARLEHTTVASLMGDGAVTLLTGPFGSTLSASEYTSSGVPIIHPSFIIDGRLTIDEASFVSAGTADRLQRWRVREGDLIFMRKRDVTRSAVVTRSEVGWVLGSDCILVRVDPARLVPHFVRAMLRAPEARLELLRRAPGTAMPGINEKSLSSLSLPVLSIDDQRAIASRWGEFDASKKTLVAEDMAALEVRRSVLTEIFGAN